MYSKNKNESTIIYSKLHEINDKKDFYTVMPS